MPRPSVWWLKAEGAELPEMFPRRNSLVLLEGAVLVPCLSSAGEVVGGQAVAVRGHVRWHETFAHSDWPIEGIHLTVMCGEL